MTARQKGKGRTQLVLGKLPPAVLTRYLLGMTGAPSSQLVVPPSLGVDFGVVEVGDIPSPNAVGGRASPGTKLIVSSDPVTGVSDRIGWYAVNVSANDVATSGNRPRFIQSIILLPEDATVGTIARISKQMSTAAKKLGITIVGGHTELTPGLKRPIVVTTAFAFARSFVTAADAREGDTIMLTKTAAVEGTAIIGSYLGGSDGWRKGNNKKKKKIGLRLGKKAEGFFEQLSVVDEAIAAFGTGAVHAMHDCTEGGVLGAAYEMSRASKLGFELREEDVPVADTTAEICSALRIDPLRLIGSGALLLAVERGAESEISAAVRGAGSRATPVGRFRVATEGRTLVRRSGMEEEVDDSPVDELWGLLDPKRGAAGRPPSGLRRAGAGTRRRPPGRPSPRP